MPKFIAVIEGYAEVIEAENVEKARVIAYNMWLEDTDQDWYVEEATQRNLANWDLEEASDEASKESSKEASDED